MSGIESRINRRAFVSEASVGVCALVGAGGGAGRLGTLETQTSAWDLTWADRLTAKYRAVFDSPDINDGTVFVNAFVFASGGPQGEPGARRSPAAVRRVRDAPRPAGRLLVHEIRMTRRDG
jgi:hypothetical protein